MGFRNPMILRQDEPSCLSPTSNPPRARSRWGVYRESGLVLGSKPAVHGAGTKRVILSTRGGHGEGLQGIRRRWDRRRLDATRHGRFFILPDRRPGGEPR